MDVALDMLEPKQAAILAARYGLRDGRPRTLREIGEACSPRMSVERVRALAEEGKRALEAIVAEFGLFRDLL